MAELIVGPVVTPGDIEVAVRETLKASYRYYLGEVDVQHGLDRHTTAVPRLFVARGENELWAEEAPPVAVVACPGTVGPPVRHGKRGSYGAWWQVNIAVTVGGATENGSRALADRHLAALMLTVGQQPEMGGLAEETLWQGARIDAIPPQRTLMGCEAVAHVYVGRVLDTRGLMPRDLPEDGTDPVTVIPPPTGVRVRAYPTD